jgi:hypothetical protein
MFLLDQGDSLYRLSNSKFERILSDPERNPLPCFAGARVRMSEVAIDLVNQEPRRVIWSTFDILVFDEDGCLDSGAFDRHQRACAELGLALPLAENRSAESRSAGTVIDAANRFVVQGGCWAPSPDLKRRIGAAALGRIKCKRL